MSTSDDYVRPGDVPAAMIARLDQSAALVREWFE